MTVGGEATTIGRDGLDVLLAEIAAQGYEVIGPTVRDGAIVYEPIATSADLPEGWTDEQEGGTYRLRRRDDDALFGYAVGPQSWKRYLYPAEVKLWRAAKAEDGGLGFEEADEPPAYAFIGVRSCELHAIAIQDRVLIGRRLSRPDLRRAPRRAFIVAVNCGEAGGTCFCVSMNTGPRAESGFDLALTELLEGDRHYFLVEAGTERGASVLAAVAAGPASEADAEAADRGDRRARSRIRAATLDTDGIKELLYGNFEHPRWDDVSERCLTCGNCTMVCPTCFCTTVEDVERPDRCRTPSARGAGTRCFTMDLSYVHGGSVRASARSRYRQWMTHKLATWIDQFGTSGCVGCGRCITWCPVAIDITEEVAAIRARRQLDRDMDACPRSQTSRRARASATSTGSPAAGATAASTPARRSLREGDAADRFFVIRRGRVALEMHVPGGRAARRRDARRRRRRRLVVAVPAVSSGSFDARAVEEARARSRSTAPACAASATPTTSSDTS